MDENVSHFRFHHSREEQDAASNLALLSNAAGRPQDEPPPVVQGTEQEDIQEGQFPWGEECSTIRWKKRDRPSSKMVAPPPPSPHPNHNHNHNHRQEEGMDPTPIAKKAKTLEMTVHHSLDDPGKCPSLAPAPFFFYRDHSQTPDEDPLTPLTPPGRVPNFPAKMHAILSRPDLADVVAWLSHGRSWRVLKPREFEIRVIPIYFEHSKFSSFIRQANGWGFRRITQGRDRNSYYNELFLRGLPHLCKTMRRPGVNQKPSADPEHEPEFAKISERFPLPANVSDDESIMLECTVKGGPKARMPVSFRGASASSVRQSSTRLSKATTEPPRHPPSHPAPSYPTSLLPLSNAPTPIHPPPNPSHSVMLSSLQMSLQAAVANVSSSGTGSNAPTTTSATATATATSSSTSFKFPNPPSSPPSSNSTTSPSQPLSEGSPKRPSPSPCPGIPPANPPKPSSHGPFQCQRRRESFAVGRQSFSKCLKSCPGTQSYSGVLSGGGDDDVSFEYGDSFDESGDGIVDVSGSEYFCEGSFGGMTWRFTKVTWRMSHRDSHVSL